VRSEPGFSLTELLVVLAIILIVTSLSIPSVSRAIDNARLKSAAQQVASIYQQARIRSTQDNTYHEVLISPLGIAPAQICLDLNGDSVCGADEPQVQLPAQVSLISQGVPVALDVTTLGFSPLTTDTSTTYNQQDMAVHALAWNARGLPCQRTSSSSPCSNWTTTASSAAEVAWIQYLQLQRSAQDAAYAAVTVSPTGRIKTWTYAPTRSGGRAWY
jgi:prepilin-type N-terminal cleavage/methylation domain-containing protein